MNYEHHIPVLLKESLDFLITDKDGIYFDATMGFGGHSEEILKHLNDGILVATDVDTEAFRYSSQKFKEEKRIRIYNFNFSQIDTISKLESIPLYDGILADLGVSSYQLDSPSAGFTFRTDAKLDLRMDKTKAVDAADIINSFAEEDLAKIFFEFGEEKNAKLIAKKICEKRNLQRIESTSDLAGIIEEITPIPYVNKSLSRVFQALRIFVNDELNALRTFLEKSVGLLKKGGRIAVISYHSLEDRIVKDIFKYETLDCICPKDFPVCKCEKEKRLKILTKKPYLPPEDEVKKNFRARSAKLRAAERL